MKLKFGNAVKACRKNIRYPVNQVHREFFRLCEYQIQFIEWYKTTSGNPIEFKVNEFPIKIFVTSIPSECAEYVSICRSYALWEIDIFTANSKNVILISGMKMQGRLSVIFLYFNVNDIKNTTDATVRLLLKTKTYEWPAECLTTVA